MRFKKTMIGALLLISTTAIISLFGCLDATSQNETDDETNTNISKVSASTFIGCYGFMNGRRVIICDLNTGMFARVQDDGSISIDATTPESAETFKLIIKKELYPNLIIKYSLFSTTKQKYVSADFNKGTNGPLYANRSEIGQWETFSPGGNIVYSEPVNEFCVKQNDGDDWRYIQIKNGKLITGPAYGEMWTLPLQLRSPVALKSYLNYNYVCADLSISPDAPLYANRTKRDLWETFDIVINPYDGALLFRSRATGKYVGSSSTTTRLTANCSANYWDSPEYNKIMFRIDDYNVYYKYLYHIITNKYVRSDSFSPNLDVKCSMDRFIIEDL